MSKRQQTINEWLSVLEKQIKRANDSMESFRRFQDADSAERLKEDAHEIEETCKNLMEAIAFMDRHNIA